MNFAEYQQRALLTDRTPTLAGDPEASRLIPLLGLSGEAGGLLTEYKKRLRDGPSHVRFVERVAEELGDILWYVSNLASKYDLTLEDIAAQNLAKAADLHGTNASAGADTSIAQDNEKFPRQFTITFTEIVERGRVEVRAQMDGRLLGAELTDNAYDDDGYRFHDVFHIANAAILGWSPVLRGLMRIKRRSLPKIDEVEDGGRAAVIEEGVVALAFDYARGHQFLQGISDIDTSVLRTIQGMCGHLEVATRPLTLWRKAILEGFKVWREVVKNRGGIVHADLDKGEVHYLGIAASATTTAATLVSE